MNLWWIVLGILLIGIMFVLWLATDCEIPVDVLPPEDRAAENLNRANRELGEQAWYTLQRMHRDAVMDCRHLRAVRMNPRTELAIRAAIGQNEPSFPWRGETFGRLYGIDVIVSPAVPDGVIIPIDNSSSPLLDLHQAVETFRPPLVDHKELQRLLSETHPTGRPPVNHTTAAEDLAMDRGCVPENYCWSECVEAAMNDVDVPAGHPADPDRPDDGHDGSVGGGCESDSG